MIEIIIHKNDDNQRLDRFLKKLLLNAPLSVIFKIIRKNNIKVNNKKPKIDYMLRENDSLKLYISDENYKKWTKRKEKKYKNNKLDIIYEDENILLVDKPYGLLTHKANKEDYGNNLVDHIISYLIETKSYIPRISTFRPAVVNRLDRNTAGIIIACKNHDSLIALNRAIKERKIVKKYLTITTSCDEKYFEVIDKIDKNEAKNKVKSSNEGKIIKTTFKRLRTNEKVSTLECNLITGRTHQIRYSLKAHNTPILGDPKYGLKSLNKRLADEFNIKNQILFAYKIEFGEIEGLKYLNNKIFISSKLDEFKKMEERLYSEF